MRYRSFIWDTARWDRFEHRPGDIVISTPPKCGTTWTQNIVAMLVLGTTSFDRPMRELSPWLDQNVHDLDEVLALLDGQTHRRFIKSHAPLDGLPWHDDVTYVAVGRDPRDVAVSWDNHMANTDLDRLIPLRADAVGLDDLAELPAFQPPLENPVERWWDWMTRREEREFSNSLQQLVIHLSSFWEARDRPNVVLLHYADLERDLEGQMRGLADRLGIAVSESRWPELVEAASFDSMSSRAATLAPNAGQFWKDDRAFFRRGGSGQWRDVIDDDRRYHQIVRELNENEEFLAWLHRP